MGFLTQTFVWFFLASLVFIHNGYFYGRINKKWLWIAYVVEFLLYFAMAMLLGRFFENQLSSPFSQAPMFHAIAFLLFVIMAAPAFAIRVLYYRQ